MDEEDRHAAANIVVAIKKKREEERESEEGGGEKSDGEKPRKRIKGRTPKEGREGKGVRARPQG
jgi:hypothetical protein